MLPDKTEEFQWRLLTTGGRNYGVGILGVGGDLGDPSIVANEGTAQLQGLGHLEFILFATEREGNTSKGAASWQKKRQFRFQCSLRCQLSASVQCWTGQNYR